MFKNLKGWTAGLFFGSLAYPLLHALNGGVPGLLVYGSITAILVCVGLVVFGEKTMKAGDSAIVYIAIALLLLIAGSFLKVWVASLVA
jgi:hypothetical protein